MLLRFVPSAGGDCMSSKPADDLGEDLFLDDEFARWPVQGRKTTKSPPLQSCKVMRLMSAGTRYLGSEGK
jgi:hypothetical protein